MSDRVFAFLLYFGELLVLTLGTAVICGFAVRLCAYLFAKLSGSGSGAVFDITAVVGTPVHELGHAAMCVIFGHKIQRVKLWSPFAKNGVYGYVEHSYNRKNPWAVLGNLPIALGPIFSGLGVTVLTLWLCFPVQWGTYLSSSQALLTAGASPERITEGVLSLLASLPSAFAHDWLRALLGLLVILSVSLHISLSWQDIKGAASALPIYFIMLLVFGIVTWLAGIGIPIASALWLWNLRMLSLFCVVIAFSAVWVAVALVIWLVRLVIGWF